MSEVAARLVAPACAAMAVLATGRLARGLCPEDPEIGLRAALALAGMTAFAIASEVTMLDTLLALKVVAALLALVPAAGTGQVRWWAATGVAIGLGVLAKGPVVLIHVLPAMVAVPLWARPGAGIAPRVMIGRIGLALLVALACVSLWMVPAILSGGPDYRNAILWIQSVGRMSDSFAHARPWWFFVALLTCLLFPWVLIPANWRAGLAARWSEPGLRLAAIWALSAFLVLSLNDGKQAHYQGPELTAAALIVARLTRGMAFRPVLPALVLVLAGLAAAVAASGTVPLGAAGRFLHPVSILLAVAFLAFAPCWVALQRGGLAGGAILSLGAVLALNLLFGMT